MNNRYVYHGIRKDQAKTICGINPRHRRRIFLAGENQQHLINCKTCLAILTGTHNPAPAWRDYHSEEARA